MNELTVTLDVQKDVASSILKSMRPEIDSDIHGRSSISLAYDTALVLHISSQDLHALRAAANTYIRWLDMCVKLAK
jgi:tRNA threonylcarbamoyladenosine modification (KEOPS) complex  Pcc1 subunit